jgi:class 3 adenylate cyclase
MTPVADFPPCAGNPTSGRRQDAVDLEHGQQACNVVGGQSHPGAELDPGGLPGGNTAVMAGQLAAVMVTDLVGSTETRVRVGEDVAESLRRMHDQMLRVVIDENNGVFVKGLGGGILAYFQAAPSWSPSLVEAARVCSAPGRRGFSPLGRV